MRFIKGLSLTVSPKGSHAARRRQFGVLAALVLVAGCSSTSGVSQGTLTYVQGFSGAVAAADPRAALIAQDVLNTGGTAADAVAAGYFAMAVGLPSSAGLGGGGVCLVHDRKSGAVEALDFLNRAPKTVLPGARIADAVPGNVRGMFALQSRYGVRRWAELVAPAEALARFGAPVSKAFARELDPVKQSLMADPGVAAILARRDTGAPVGEGDLLLRPDLASVLSLIRAKGVGDFYQGPWARRFVAADRAAGGSLDLADLRDFSPQWRAPLKVPFGSLISSRTAYFAAPPEGGALAARMWAMIVRDGGFASDDAAARAHLLAEVSMRAFAKRGGGQVGNVAQIDTGSKNMMASFDSRRHTPASHFAPLSPTPRTSPSAASIVAVDPQGDAVACAFTLGAAFGTGKVAQGTGIFLAENPTARGRSSLALTPMLVTNDNVHEVYFAAAAGGGLPAPAALVNVAARTQLAGVRLGAAMAAPRVFNPATPDITFYEPTMKKAVIDALSRRGHHLGKAADQGRVVAISCPDGLPPKPGSCQVSADTRGAGLGVGAQH
ncbi:gamma-glutamyltransferase [Varunaivibrio sulfuroxidans]|uniref:Gamma-glutamyltranspeptidase/glutathione hydrolase n=1 Tax=Varunaivibrio sulfuroxidans TaxID=1773489 RepID=A0A4R3J8I5_9PROT|nr:gamma-glutamyltransferase [Varunaivibrio sulfuroxidans]TCS62148.1 gamma-glutamyltranspeptidase/glutathione hydrolase [Varunaivibrio sulfuroxidans]WES30579.1 gamma-glutamyltransferase [Varunaivibrio sulfuroxidans]